MSCVVEWNDFFLISFLKYILTKLLNRHTESNYWFSKHFLKNRDLRGKTSFNVHSSWLHFYWTIALFRNSLLIMTCRINLDRSYFFRFLLRSYFKVFESGSGNSLYLRIRLLFRLRLQSLIQPKF